MISKLQLLLFGEMGLELWGGGDERGNPRFLRYKRNFLSRGKEQRCDINVESTLRRIYVFKVPWLNQSFQNKIMSIRGLYHTALIRKLVTVLLFTKFQLKYLCFSMITNSGLSFIQIR